MMVGDENGNGIGEAVADSATAAANNNNCKAHRAGITHEEMVTAYSEWARSYEKDLCPGRYNGPEIAADVMSHYIHEEDRPKIRILDVAAGTGRVGVELVKKDFKNIDALEPSEGMMNVLAEKKIYGKLILSSIGYEPVKEIESETYDALVIAGGMGEGHIPVCALDEMLRIVKKDGLIFIVMREQYLEIVEEYKGLENYMKELVLKQFCIQIERKIVPKYSFQNNGVVYVFQKI